MELAFETVALRLVCESDTEARKRYPAGAVDELQARLADIRAATSASDLVVCAPSVDLQPPGCIRFSLSGGLELVCACNHPSPPLTHAGLVNLDRVRRVRVVTISEEYPNE
jgi:hypothetical protein